jgi:5'-nucleotidase
MAGRDCALVRFQSSPPLIVLTNDDGVSSPGLAFLKSALDPLGEIRIVAPDQNRSGAARSITMRSPLWVEEVLLEDGSLAYSTDGTPVDCVRMAALGLLDREPDLIVSGINLGGNLGDDITYSGTVAAAFEGIMLDIPAIALSAEGYHLGYDLAVPARLAQRLVSLILARGFPAKTLLNINCPDRSWDELGGIRLTTLGKRIYGDKVEFRESRGNRRGYHIYNDDLSYHREPGSDFEAIAEGWVSITPLHFDLMSHEALDEIRGWEGELRSWTES